MARQASLDKKAAAIYDVREKLGPSLFASRDLQEFRDRVAMMKDDQSIYRVIGAHLHPSTGVVRSIVGRNSVLEKEFKAILAASEDDMEDRSTVTDSQKEQIAKGEKADDVETNSGDGSDADGDDAEDCDDDDAYKNAARLHQADKQQYLKNQGYQTADTEDEDGVRRSGPSQPKKGNRRLSDFNGEVDTDSTFSPSDADLVPEDNWDGYLNSVDQDSGKVDRNFTSAADRMAWTVYTDWAQAQNLHPGKLATLDTYSANLADGQYFRLARMVQAGYPATSPGANLLKEKTKNSPEVWNEDEGWVDHKPKTPKGQSKSKLTDVTAARRKALADAGLDPVDPTGSGTDGNFNAPTTLAEPFGGAGGPNSPDHGMPGEQGKYGRQRRSTPGLDPADPNMFAPDTMAEPFGGAGGPDSPDHGMPGEQGRLGQRDPMRAYVAWCKRNGYQRLSARNIEIFAGNNPEVAFNLAYRMRNAMRTAWVRRQAAWDPVRGMSAPGAMWSDEERARRKQEQAAFEEESKDWPRMKEFPYTKMRPGGYPPGWSKSKESRRRTAAPDYLQKADDALTQLLNQKAEEFQQTIAPLQQALVTVQQAEQLQQAQNPMNVLPPPGTVNVMPGGDQGPAGLPAPGAQDLGAAAQALAGAGGGAPPGGPDQGAPDGGMAGQPDQGPPPAAGAQGGLPPELQQMMARKRGGSGKGRGAGRPRQAGPYTQNDRSPWAKGPGRWEGEAPKDSKGNPADSPLTPLNMRSTDTGLTDYDSPHNSGHQLTFNSLPEGEAEGYPQRYQGNPYQPHEVPSKWLPYSKEQMQLPPPTDDRLSKHWQDLGYKHDTLDKWRQDAPHMWNASYDDMAEFNQSIMLGRGDQDFYSPKDWKKYQESKEWGGPFGDRTGRAQRTAADVHTLWKKWQDSHTGRGSDSDYEEFASEYGIGQRALQKLKRDHGQGKDPVPFARINQDKWGSRTATNVTDLWEKFQNGNSTLRGDDSDYEQFAQQFGVGQRALNKLKQQHGHQMPTLASRRQTAGDLFRPEDIKVPTRAEQESISNHLNGLIPSGPPADPWGKEMAHRGMQWAPINYKGGIGGYINPQSGETAPSQRPAPYRMNQLSYPGHERDQWLDFNENHMPNQVYSGNGKNPYGDKWKGAYGKELTQWAGGMSPGFTDPEIGNFAKQLYSERRAEQPDHPYSEHERGHAWHDQIQQDGGEQYPLDGSRNGGSWHIKGRPMPYSPPEDWTPGQSSRKYLKGGSVSVARKRYLAWCKRHQLTAASTKNLYWYLGHRPREAALLLGETKIQDPYTDENAHDFHPGTQQVFFPQRGHETWDFKSGPSGKPYVRDQGEKGKHEAAAGYRWGPHPQIDGGFHTPEGQFPRGLVSPMGDYGPGYIAHVLTGQPEHDSDPTNAQVGVFKTPEEAMSSANEAMDWHKANSTWYAMHHGDPSSWAGSRKAGVEYEPYQLKAKYQGKQGSRKQAWSGWGPAVFPKTRQVTGWDWDNHLNGYKSHRPQHFACECGDSFPTPSGFHRCACGRQWNSYVIGSGGNNREAAAEQFLVREIPVRPDVIVANRQLAAAKKVGGSRQSNLMGGPPDDYGLGKNYPPDHLYPWTKAEAEAEEEKAPPKKKGGKHDRPTHYGPNKHELGEPDWVPIQQRVHQDYRSEEEAFQDAMSDPDHPGRYQHGALYKLTDPGEIDDEGEDDGMPTFKQQPKDWARRGDGAKWQGSPIGKA